MPSSLTMSSPDRLGMLYPPTCVGFGTGADDTCLEVFLGSMGIADFSSCASSHVSGMMRSRICLRCHPTRFHGDVQNPAQLPFSVTPSVITIRQAVQEYQPVVHRLRLSASP